MNEAGKEKQKARRRHRTRCGVKLGDYSLCQLHRGHRGSCQRQGSLFPEKAAPPVVGLVRVGGKCIPFRLGWKG